MPWVVGKRRHRRTVEHALRRLVGSRVVRRTASTCENSGQLLEEIASQEGYNAVALLVEVARLLGLPMHHRLHFPSISLLQEIQLSGSVMQEKAILPQRQSQLPLPATPILVVADTATVPKDVQLPLALGLSSSIQQTWSRFIELQLASEAQRFTPVQCELLVQQLVEDAESLGATEVFLGHPDASRFEFITGMRKYCGCMHPEVYRVLLDQLSQGALRTLTSKTESGREVQLALTNNETAPVLFVTWRGGVAASPPAGALP